MNELQRIGPHNTDNYENVKRLLTILSVEIYRDGGISCLNALPEYNPIISKLLTSMKKKLVCFLQSYPDFFHVDRENKPHSVKLQKEDLLTNAKPMGERIFFDCHNDNGKVLYAKRKLQRKTGYEIQKRASKLRRRNERSAAESTIGTQNEESITDVSATLDWLCRKVQTELHCYIRLFSNRPIGVLPRSDEWFVIASALYLQFLEKLENESDDSEISFRISKTHPEDERYNHIGTHVHMLPSSNSNAAENHPIVEQIAAKVKSILQTNAPPIGGMDFGKLLQDYQLRVLTGGKDLRALIEDNPDLFKEMRVFRDERRMKDNSDKCGGFYIEFINRPDGIISDTPCTVKTSALAADETGTYSLTKPRLAIAMAKLLINACKYGNLGLVEKGAEFCSGKVADRDAPLEPFTCIDLTAGIGGNTIAFCKTFDQVYAYEIDSSRVNLLKRNLDAKLTTLQRDKVTIRCEDSTKALEELSLQLRQNADWRDKLKGSRVAVFVDPPFGGLHYRTTLGRSKKEDICESLNLGKDMPLNQVVALVSAHLSPVIIGLKVPLLFDVALFVKTVEKLKHPHGRGDSCEIRIKIIKKMERQLFVILDVRCNKNRHEQCYL